MWEQFTTCKARGGRRQRDQAANSWPMKIGSPGRPVWAYAPPHSRC